VDVDADGNLLDEDGNIIPDSDPSLILNFAHSARQRLFGLRRRSCLKTHFPRRTRVCKILRHSHSRNKPLADKRTKSRTGHTGAGPSQAQATRVHDWVKGHSGVPGNERADTRAGKAAAKPNPSPIMSIAHIKLKISEQYRKAKEDWHADPANNGSMEIPPPAPQEALPRQSAELHSLHRSTDPVGPLAIGSLPETDPQTI